MIVKMFIDPDNILWAVKNERVNSMVTYATMAIAELSTGQLLSSV